MLTGCEPRHITEGIYMTIFNRNLYNQHIMKYVSRHSHNNLQSAFNAAYKAEAKAKKLEGLNNDVSVMKIDADADINYIQARDKQPL